MHSAACVTCHVSHFLCCMSHVTCHWSCVTCRMSHITLYIFYKVVELVSEGSVINGAYPV